MPGLDKEAVKALIREAFAHAKYPGDWCLQGSYEGDEPFEAADMLKGKNDREALDGAFLDRVPGGLNFLSDEAYHFYLPAYLISDLDGRLECVDPSFSLIHGLTKESKDELINPRRYGRRTWNDHARHQFSMFDAKEAAAIAAYLRCRADAYRAEGIDSSRQKIEEALDSYWTPRAQEAENSD